MKLPKALTVSVLEQSTDLPLEGAAIVLELFATRKNNYTIGPMVSDSEGLVRFSREDCERSVQADKAMFVMDYIDDIENCKSYVEVKLHSAANIAQMLRQYEISPTFWGTRFPNPAQLFEMLARVKNASLEPKCLRIDEPQLLNNPNVVLRTLRKL